MYSAYNLNKQGDNIQPWRTPFPIWNQSVVPCSVLTVVSWPAYRFLRRQVRWSDIPISLGIFRSLLWSSHSVVSNSSDPVDYSPPGSFVHGISQARILERVAMPSPRGSSRSRDRTRVSHIAGRCFNLWATRVCLLKKWYSFSLFCFAMWGKVVSLILLPDTWDHYLNNILDYLWPIHR